MSRDQRKNHRLISLLVAFAILALAAAVGAADWPQWRGPNRDGKSADTGLLKSWPAGGPPRLWAVSDIGDGYSSPAISDGWIYITGLKNGQLVITVFDLAGKRQGAVTVGPDWEGNRPGVRATTTIHEGRIYIETAHGEVVCLDAKSGKKYWSRSLTDEFGGRTPKWGYSESVLIDDGKAIVSPGGRRASLAALDAQTGKTEWLAPVNGAPAHYSSPIRVDFEGRALYVQGNGGGIFGVDAETGKALWQNDFCAGNTANCPTPAYSDGYIFWANGYGKGGIGLQLTASGKDVGAREVYRSQPFVCHHGGYIVHEGHVYGNAGRGWMCIDLKTGKPRWRAEGVGKGSLCYADGMLYLFSEDNGLAGLAKASPDGFEMTGQFNVAGRGKSWAHPVVCDGRLYLRYHENLYCFDVKKK